VVWEKSGGRSSASIGGGVASRSDASSIGKHTLVEQIEATVSAPMVVAPIVQRRVQGEATSVASPTEIARQGTSGVGGSLPHLDLIQKSFGHHDVSGVTAHQDRAAGRAAGSLGASAFAFGNSVAFAGTPDLHTAAHEAAHVVQQRGGVQLKGGIDSPGDEHERHADAVADAVVAGHSAVPLLEQYSGGRGSPTVQRKNATITPDGLPDPAPPASIPPPASEPHVDTEGHKIVQEGGHWHLAEPPKDLKFPLGCRLSLSAPAHQSEWGVRGIARQCRRDPGRATRLCEVVTRRHEVLVREGLLLRHDP
jgi:hypothetical protein